MVFQIMGSNKIKPDKKVSEKQMLGFQVFGIQMVTVLANTAVSKYSPGTELSMIVEHCITLYTARIMVLLGAALVSTDDSGAS